MNTQIVMQYCLVKRKNQKKLTQRSAKFCAEFRKEDIKKRATLIFMEIRVRKGQDYKLLKVEVKVEVKIPDKNEVEDE